MKIVAIIPIKSKSERVRERILEKLRENLSIDIYWTNLKNVILMKFMLILIVKR